MTGIVIVNLHEPHHEVAGRLLQLADEKGYDVRTIVAQRGEHNAALSFQVPGDVQEAFDADRAGRWPAPEEPFLDPNNSPARKARPGKAGS